MKKINIKAIQMDLQLYNNKIKLETYRAMCLASALYISFIGAVSMHNNISISSPKYVSRHLVDKVAETEYSVENNTVDIEAFSINYANQLTNPFGVASAPIKERKTVMPFYKVELVDDRLENLVDGNGAVPRNRKAPVGDFAGVYYELDNDEIVQIARLCTQEQGYSVDGVQAEASLMLNRYEKHGNGYSSLMSYIRNSGWWHAAGYYMDNGKTTDELVEAVREVVEGERFFPINVDEHDCLRDIISVSNNGVEFDIYDKSQYISGVTKIRNRYHSTYTFYAFPTSESDPFGMIET